MSEQIETLNQKIADLEKQLEEAQVERTSAQAIAIEHTQELFKRQRQFDLLIDIASISTGANSTQDAMGGILRLLCTYMRWSVGHVLIQDPHAPTKMISSKTWFSSLTVAIEDFQAITEQLRFDESTGLPGQALATGQAVWCSEIDESQACIRGAAAARSGLRYALAFPIQAQEETTAILEFFSEVPIDDDAITKEIIKQTSGQLARVFERRQAQLVNELYAEQLEKNAEQLSRIAHIGSHDLQEPLRKIEVFMSRLQRSDAKVLSESGKDSLDKIGIASRRMSALVRDLLELVYIATDQWKLSEVNLDKMMDRIRDIRLRRQLEEGDEFLVGALPVLWSEPEVTQQVFEELVDNAIQFRRPEENLRIAVSYQKSDDEFFEIKVQDDGIGFAPEYAEQIFVPFQSLQRNESEERTGVGLAICRRAMERMGGTLTASSEGANTGACFTIRLPVTLVF